MTASVKSVYHDELGIYLTGKPLLALAEAVTDLDKLREVCCAMAMRGIGKGNVECALEWYRDGIPYRGKEGKRDERVKVGQAGYRGNGGGSSRSRYRPDSEKQYGRWNDV